MSTAIEYHPESDCWFVSRIENGRYVDYSICPEDGDEIQPAEMRGPWPIESTAEEIMEAIYKLCMDDQHESVFVRSAELRVTGFNGFYLGYDMIRFYFVSAEAIRCQ